MELLLGSIVSLLVSLFKVLSEKFGKEFAKPVFLMSAFLLSLVVALFLSIAPKEWLEGGIEIWTSAIAFYEVITKRIVVPVLEKYL